MRWVDADGRPRRHARVWLDRTTWRAALRGSLDADRVAALDAWICAGRAVVARRRDDVDRDACCLAVALPLIAGRTRIGFTIDGSAVVRIDAPLTLAEAMLFAPASWRDALADLCDRAMRIGAGFHVYGSLAWQAICGTACVRPGSDVDLLWTAGSIDAVDRVLAELAAWEAAWGLRADGELVLANGDGIAWRELTTASDRVLVKHQDRVSLQPAPTYWHARLAACAASPA